MTATWIVPSDIFSSPYSIYFVFKLFGVVFICHLPIWRIISLNLSSLLFQNEQTIEILIPCSTFILYVDYVWSPILHDRDVCTLSEVRLSLLQAKTGTTKRFYTCWFFFFLGSSLLKIKYLQWSRKSPGSLVRLTGFVEVIKLLKPTRTGAF